MTAPTIRTSYPDAKAAIDRFVPTPEPASIDDEMDYFANTTAPEYLPQIETEVKEWAQRHNSLGKRIVVITSGGTTVPLENNTVRFIDNFSAGTRGATSAEIFLKEGYAVIFLYREFSLLPFSRRYQHHNVFDFLELKDGKAEARTEFQAQITRDLEAYTKYKDQLLTVPFTTVTQYLYTLRLLGLELEKYGNTVMFYLAAAVSDFFIPNTRISEHKIQSQGTGKLVIDLDPVPKFLRRLVNQWTPGAMIVSFKLETDPDLLLKKCWGALDRYGHQLVIGNLLQTRKNEVFFVQPDKSPEKITIPAADSDVEIEQIFVPQVIELHSKYISST